MWHISFVVPQPPPSIAMAQWKALLLFGLVISAAYLVAAEEDEVDAADDDYAEAERAFLVTRKYFQDGKEDRGVQGRNLTVTIEVFNAGPV